MKEIVKTLLMEGIDESTIHRVIDIIAEGSHLEDMVKRAHKKGKIINSKRLELQDKALRVPSSNDYHFDNEGKLHTSNMTTGGKLTKNDIGRFHTDARRKRDGDELFYKRYNDEQGDYRQAKAKSIRRHNEK